MPLAGWRLTTGSSSSVSRSMTRARMRWWRSTSRSRPRSWASAMSLSSIRTRWRRPADSASGLLGIHAGNSGTTRSVMTIDGPTGCVCRRSGGWGARAPRSGVPRTCRPRGRPSCGVGDVIIDDLAVDDGCMFTGDHDGGVIAGAAQQQRWSPLPMASGATRRPGARTTGHLLRRGRGHRRRRRSGGPGGIGHRRLQASDRGCTRPSDGHARDREMGLPTIRRPCTRRGGPTARKQPACAGRLGSGDRPLARRPRRLPAGRPDHRRDSGGMSTLRAQGIASANAR